jgi:quinone-modifying oxidoreductase subunit QmoC
MAKVNPDFVKELKKFGADDFKACFSCGNCTAICATTDKNNSFPRKLIRYSLLGLEGEIKASADPWMCYYCGDCSGSCPRQANPGNLMMALRRYLTSKYDWTGLSGLLYKHVSTYFLAFALIFAAVFSLQFGGILNQEEFLHYGHLFEMFSIGGIFILILLPNIIHMWYLIVWSKTKKIVLKDYIVSLKDLFTHMFTQKRSLDCDDTNPKDVKEAKVWWFEHFILVIGYLSLLFTTVFLDWFKTESSIVIYMGYVFSAIVFIVTFDFVMRRIQKRTEKSSFTHPSDWFFVIWLFLMGVTAFAVRLFIDLDIIENNFWMYLFHISILAQWALIIVPFGKWTHFLYRSFAMYFSSILEASAKKK